MSTEEPVPVVEDAAAPEPAQTNGDSAPPAAEAPPAEASEKPASTKAEDKLAPSADSKPTSRPASSRQTRTKPDTAKPSSPTKKDSKPAAKPRASVPAGGSKAKKDVGEKSFSPSDIVLARLKGFPPWPARVVDPETIPRNVLMQRPGKSPQIYCVQYFPAGDFSWLHVRDINPLSSSDIKAYLAETHRKPHGGLREAYVTAEDPTEWDEAQNENQRAIDQADEGIDELADEDAEAGTGGKRKKSGEGKSKKKAKVDKPKSAPAKKAEPAPKSKPEKPKAEKKPDSKPAPAAAADDDDPSSNPESIRVKDWRHKLQRAFLGKGLPTAEEMTQYDDLFKTIEGYTGMTIEALQYSKIGKVMKKISSLEGIPRNDEFKITDRATKLMNDWSKFIAQSNGGANGDD